MLTEILAVLFLGGGLNKVTFHFEDGSTSEYIVAQRDVKKIIKAALRHHNGTYCGSDEVIKVKEITMTPLGPGGTMAPLGPGETYRKCGVVLWKQHRDRKISSLWPFPNIFPNRSWLS